ncbi:cupin domain-containing protein [Gammaproteobacteria bacterium]|jgi:hypothetical protein|nr:cupin domain-containing protein [Gammaproteobacteria bacterium]
MSSIEVKSFVDAEEINTSFNNAKIEAVNVGGQRVVRLTLKPGWKWSIDVKPSIGTNTCQASHLGVIISGSICCRHDDGTEATYTAGDAYSIKPGHDAWVVGDEVAEAFEFAGMWGE